MKYVSWFREALLFSSNLTDIVNWNKPLLKSSIISLFSAEKLDDHPIFSQSKITSKGQRLTYWLFTLHVLDTFRYRIYLKAFLCNVSIWLKRSFMKFFDISNLDSSRAYFSRNSSNLEIRFASSSWVEFTVSDLSISSSLLSLS